jgi:hypothetical protein
MLRVFGTRVLDKENYKFDEGNENAKEVKASKTVKKMVYLIEHLNKLKLKMIKLQLLLMMMLQPLK